MKYDCVVTYQTSQRAINHFIDWLYEECPVNTDEVTRKKLAEVWEVYRETGTTPSREEILPASQIMTPQERKDKLFKILK